MPLQPADFFHSKNQKTKEPTAVTPDSLKEKLMRPALTSHFQCWFDPPTAVVDWMTSRGLNYKQNAEFISLSCSEASLPGSSLATNDINDDFTGVTERHAYRRQYDDRADFTFYVDSGRQEGNYNIIWFFESWISYIVNERRTSTITIPNRSNNEVINVINNVLSNINSGSGINEPSFNYRVQFPSKYQSTIFINKFEKDYDDSYFRYDFLQAYPISINSMPVSYDSSQLLKCTVSFTYTRYVVNKIRGSGKQLVGNELSESQNKNNSNNNLPPEAQLNAPPNKPKPNSSSSVARR